MRFNLCGGHQGTTCYVPSLNVKIRENLKIYYLGKIHFVLGFLLRNSMLRTIPLTEALNPLSKMEFYGGHKRLGEAESMHPSSKVDYLLMEFFFNFCEQESQLRFEST